MPRKRTKEWNGPVSDEALIVWLMDKPYLIMKALREGCENATEIGDELGKPIAWVSKRTGRMVEIGLIGKEGPDIDGVRKISLTDKGRRVLQSIDNINGNILFIELKRSLGISSPHEDKRSTVHEEAARVKNFITSDEGDGQDLATLYAKVLEASMTGVGDWYSCVDLEWLLSSVQSERWDERSRLLLVKLIGKAVVESKMDCEYTFNGLVEPLGSLAMDDGVPADIRIEAIMTIGAFKDRDGMVPDNAFEAILQIVWQMLSPDHIGFELMEGTVSEVLKKWTPLLSKERKNLLLRSVDRARYGRMPTLDDLMEKGMGGRHREVEETKFESYRSLVSSILGRDVLRARI